MDRLFTTPFLIRAALGVVPGCEILVQKFENPSIEINSVPEDLWNYGGTMVYSESADIDTISSSSASDTGPVLIEGLDANWDKISQVAMLDGLNKVSITPMIRCHKKQNVGPDAWVGNIYTYVDSDITLGIPDDPTKIRMYALAVDGRSFMPSLSIARNNTGFILWAFEGLSKAHAASATLVWCSRLFGSEFVRQNKLTPNTAGSTLFSLEFPGLEPLPAKTDITVKCIECTANNTGVVGSYSILQVDNDFLKHY